MMNERNTMEYVPIKRKCNERNAGGEIRLEHIM